MSKKLLKIAKKYQKWAENHSLKELSHVFKIFWGDMCFLLKEWWKGPQG